MRIAGLVMGTVLAVGCGATHPAPARPAPAHRSPRYAVRCLPAQLRLAAGPRIPERTQQDTLLIVVRNISASGCDVRGYPGIALYDGGGARLAFSYRRQGDQMLASLPPAVVALPPGGAAYSALNKNTCAAFERRIATRVTVTIPGDRGPVVLRLPRYPILGYCDPGDPGHTIDIAPFTATMAGLLRTSGVFTRSAR